MKCKKCGGDLPTGTKKCPYCGTVVKIVRKRADEVFDWSWTTQAKKRKKDVSVDWSSGRLYDRRSGQVYSQADNAWSEPEDVKDLFKFDRKNEEYQQVLDQQVEIVSGSADIHEPRRSEESVNVKVSEDGKAGTFERPSLIKMKPFSSLLKDDIDVVFVNESGEEKSFDELNGRQKASPAPEKAAEKSQAGISPEPAEKARSNENSTKEPESKEPAESTAANEKGYTAEEEDRVFSSLQKLMEAEEKFRTDMERVSYLTPEENEQAARVEEKSSKLSFVPTMSFRTIEDEYDAYCDENGIEHKRPARPEPVPDKPAAEKRSLRETIKNSFKLPEKDKDKAVEIKINEPTGTKVTVKTQEINIASAAMAEKAQTREVNMAEVVKPPKNLQVSVEVNAAQGNASVEVTRRHDGATVVKTVDESNQEHIYTDKQTEEEPKLFWEPPEDRKKMTITDIFGPEARDIINGFDVEKNDVEDEKEKSIILDIKPEDIAMTPEQTHALYTISREIDDEEPENEKEEAETAEEETETEQPEEVSEPDTEMPVMDKTPEEAAEQDNETESAETVESTGDEPESETEPEPEEATEKITEEPQEESSMGTPPEKTAPIMKAEKALKKEAARQARRRKHEEKQLEIKEDEPEKKKLSGILKFFIVILVIILIAEFSIIGIKLFASGSQAAVFIEKVEDYAADLIKGGDSAGTQSGSSAHDEAVQQTADESGTDAGAGGA